MNENKIRKSGIEFLKIIAIFLIIVSHVLQSYSNTYNGVLNNTTLDYEYLCMIFIRHLGVLGNLIFIICSSWFLIGSKKDYKQKILKLIIEIFVISVLILLIHLLLGVNITKGEIIKSCLPTLSANNWYTTCYIMFLMIVPFLNMILEKLYKKQLLRLCIVLFFMYFIICAFANVLFINNLVIFIAIFFMIAYIKNYMNDFTLNKKKNLIMLGICTILFVILIVITNYLGTRNILFNGKALFWNKNNNILLLLSAIAIFNLFKNLKFKNKSINYTSALTLYIYVIHENLLVRNHLRIDIWKWIGEKYTYNNIIIEAIIYAVMLFLVSLIISIIYKYTIKKIIDYLVEKIMNSKLKKYYNKIENRILEIK